MSMERQIDQWFAEADADQDQRVSPGEAKAFFTRTGLDRNVLGQIWTTVKQRGGGGGSTAQGDPPPGLDRKQFANFLKLAAVAQSGIELDEETAELALHPSEWLKAYGTPLPAPSVAPLDAAPGGSVSPPTANAGPQHSSPLPPPPLSPSGSLGNEAESPRAGAAAVRSPVPPRRPPARPAPVLLDPATQLGMLSLSVAAGSEPASPGATLLPTRITSTEPASPGGTLSPARAPPPVPPRVARSASGPLPSGGGAAVFERPPLTAGKAFRASRAPPPLPQKCSSSSALEPPALRPTRPAPTAAPGERGSGGSGGSSWCATPSPSLLPEDGSISSASRSNRVRQVSDGGEEEDGNNGASDDADGDDEVDEEFAMLFGGVHTSTATVAATSPPASVQLSPAASSDRASPALTARRYSSIRSFREGDTGETLWATEEEEPPPSSPSAGRLGRGASLVRTLGHNFQGQCKREHVAEGEYPVHFDARLPPLDASRASSLLFLAAGNGTMVAGPVSADKPGRLLQWGRPEGNLRWPDMDAALLKQHQEKEAELYRKVLQGGQYCSLPVEDPDSAPSCLVKVAPSRVTAMHVDEAHGLLWVGDKDGYVTGFDIGTRRGGLLGEWKPLQCEAMSPQHRRYHFQAYRAGRVTAICRSPAGGLWTGSARGSVRIFDPVPGGANMRDARELRRGGTVIGPVLPKAHQKKVIAIVAPQDGRVMWTSSINHLCLWCSMSGVYLGELSRKDIPINDLRDIRDAITPQPVQKVYQDASKINCKEGLLGDEAGQIKCVPSMASADRSVRQQRDLREKSDTGISERVTFVANNAKHIGLSIAKSGQKGLTTLLSKARKGIMKAGRDLADGVMDDDSNAYGGSSNSSGYGGGSGATGGPGSRGARSTSALPPQYEDDDVASQSGIGDPSADEASEVGQIEAVAATAGSQVWVGYKKGVLDQYTALGRLIKSVSLQSPVLAVSGVGQHVWVGTAAGRMYVFDTADGRLLREWDTAAAAVIGISPAGSRCYSLAADGSVRGWGSRLPSSVDTLAWERWRQDQPAAMTQRPFKIFALTWNVNEMFPDSASSAFFGHLRSEVAPNRSYSVAVFGLQEIEMGANSVAAAATRELLRQKKALEKGNDKAKIWSAALLKAMNGDTQDWFQVGLRQLCGIFVVVLARRELRPAIGEVMSSYVTTGVLGGLGGNKGAVAVSFTLWRRRVTVLSSHFAAHQENLNQRNENYRTISRQLKFASRFQPAHGHALQGGGAGASGGVPVPGSSGYLEKNSSLSAPRGVSHHSGITGDDSDDDYDDMMEGDDINSLPDPSLDQQHQGHALRNSEVLVWLGDFNYRVDLSFNQAIKMISGGDVAGLVAKDQCRQAMRDGSTFIGLREGDIHFLPTYKFDKPGKEPREGRKQYPYGFDSSDKERVPSYTDRIFFRGSKPFPRPVESVAPGSGGPGGLVGSGNESSGSGSSDTYADEDESSAASDILPTVMPEEDGLGDVVVSCEMYDSLMNVMESDHKPVFAVLRVDMPTWDQDKKRRLASHIMKQYFKVGDPPQAVLDTLGDAGWEMETAPVSVVSNDDENDDSDEGSDQASHDSGRQQQEEEEEERDTGPFAMAAVAATLLPGPARGALQRGGNTSRRHIRQIRVAAAPQPPVCRPALTLHVGSQQMGQAALVNKGRATLRYSIVRAGQQRDFEVGVQVWPATGFVPACSTATLNICARTSPSCIRGCSFEFQIRIDHEYSAGGDRLEDDKAAASGRVLRFAVHVEAGLPERSSGGFGKGTMVRPPPEAPLMSFDDD